MEKMYKIILVLSLVLISGCAQIELNKCVSDDDCVADSCCHAKGCVNVENAPNCEDIECTMVCEPGTLDCGQGACKCINGGCIAVFK